MRRIAKTPALTSLKPVFGFAAVSDETLGGRYVVNPSCRCRDEEAYALPVPIAGRRSRSDRLATHAPPGMSAIAFALRTGPGAR